MRRLKSRIISLVEEADLDMGFEWFEFVKGFEECLRCCRVYFEAFDESFLWTSNERLLLERATGKAVVDLVTCLTVELVEL